VSRKATAVTQAAIGAYFDQAAYVLVDFSPQVTFSGILPVHQFSNAVHLGLGKLIHPRRKHRVDVGLGEYLGGDVWADAVDTAESDMSFFSGPVRLHRLYEPFASSLSLS
jgi:hypothetical protein